MMRLSLVLVVVLCACADNILVSKNRSPIEVVRASANQPAIRINISQNPDLELFETQGYLEAQDRFLQMDILRRQTQGQLAEIFGEKVAEKDRLAYGAGLVESIDLTTVRIQNEFPETYLYLEAFTKGVNRYLSNLENEKPELLKFYRYYTLDKNYVPRVWHPKDSVAIAKGITFHLSSSLQEKLLMTSVVVALKDSPIFANLSSYFDFRPLDATFILGNAFQKKEAPLVPTPTSANKSAHLEALRQLPIFGCESLGFPFPDCRNKSSIGSNNFVINREFSGTGASILENDPHLGLTFPSTFYEVALDSTPAGGSFKMRGMNLPGVPGILIGHNDTIAWGMTNLGADVDDLYLEGLDNNSESAVVQPVAGGPETLVALRVESKILKIRQPNGQLKELTIPYRVVPQHGPIVSDHLPETVRKEIDGLKLRQNRRAALSYRWTGHGGTAELPAILGVTRAKNFTEFKAALQTFDAGAQNIIYADRAGNIGYYSHGKFPIRNYFLKAQELEGVYPIPFTPVFGLGSQEWSGMRESVPELYNPKEGRIVTANNDPYGHSANPNLSDYEDYFGLGFSSGSRAKRMTELLDANRGRVDEKVVAGIQMDHKDLVAEHFLSLLEQVVSRPELGPEAKSFAARMLHWKTKQYDANREFQEPVLFHEWFGALSDKQFVDIRAPLGKAFEYLRYNTVAYKTVYHKLKSGLAAEVSQASTLKILRETLETAAKTVKSNALEHATWGEVRRLKFNNILDGILPTAMSFPVPRNGSWDTVDVAEEGVGPNFRLILKVSDAGIEGWNALPGGNWPSHQTARAISEIDRWRDGNHRELVPFIQ